MFSGSLRGFGLFVYWKVFWRDHFVIFFLVSCSVGLPATFIKLLWGTWDYEKTKRLESKVVIEVLVTPVFLMFCFSGVEKKQTQFFSWLFLPSHLGRDRWKHWNGKGTQIFPSYSVFFLGFWFWTCRKKEDQTYIDIHHEYVHIYIWYMDMFIHIHK